LIGSVTQVGAFFFFSRFMATCLDYAAVLHLLVTQSQMVSGISTFDSVLRCAQSLPPIACTNKSAPMAARPR
jgi:hypothetical protein